MTPELIAMLGGGVSGFVMKLIGYQMESQARQFERMIGKQKAADKSADAAANRSGGVLVRRFLVASTVFAIVIAPFVFAWTDVGVSVARETNGFLGLFKGVKWETIQGFVILPEIRQTALAIVGFYFGSSQIK
tara:strand:- start:2320 stop:2718 length:399 start_codon:yes stop_codon:yes gene_type:complete